MNVEVKYPTFKTDSSRANEGIFGVFDEYKRAGEHSIAPKTISANAASASP